MNNEYCTLTFVSLPKVALHKESSLRPPSKLPYGNLAITDLCVCFVLEPIAVIYSDFRFQKKIGYLLFPTSETLRRMSTSFGLSDIWDRAFEWTSDSYGYEWLLVFKATISQSELTLVYLHCPKNLCAESLYPFLL